MHPKAMSETEAGVAPMWKALDSWAQRMVRINKIYNLFLPTDVAWLLQYSGSRVEHRDGFSWHK